MRPDGALFSLEDFPKENDEGLIIDVGAGAVPPPPKVLLLSAGLAALPKVNMFEDGSSFFWLATEAAELPKVNTPA